MSDKEITRNQKIIGLWKTGSYTKASIGRIFKMSRERIRKIVEDYEYDQDIDKMKEDLT